MTDPRQPVPGLPGAKRKGPRPTPTPGDSMTHDQWAELEAASDGGKPEKEMSLRTRVLLALTLEQDEHPEEYDGPCRCKTCALYADDYEED